MTSVKHINQIFFHPNAFKQLKIRIDSLGFKNREVAYFIDKFFEKETGKLDFNS